MNRLLFIYGSFDPHFLSTGKPEDWSDRNRFHSSANLICPDLEGDFTLFDTAPEAFDSATDTVFLLH